MLSENFVTSTAHAPTKATATTANATVVRDASIHLHVLQPALRLHASFKSSQTQNPNTLAINDTHVFAAQSGKATLHVYSRERQNQEAIVSFGDRISSVTLMLDGDVLVAGTEKGRLIFWEIKTGRAIHTTAAHIQPVSCLAADNCGQNVVSGSADAVVHVWNVLEHLRISIAGSDEDTAERGPRHTFTAHKGPITGAVMGHSTTACNFVLTASEDKTVRSWNYFDGLPLRTFMLDAMPLSLALDPADRAAFVGCEDGRIALIDFFAGMRSRIHIPSGDEMDYSVQITPPHYWITPGSASRQSLGDPSAAASVSTPSKAAPKAEDIAHPNSILCASLNHNGTILLTGHTSSCVNAWETATGRFLGTRAFYPTSGAVINLHFLPMTGLGVQKPLPSACNTVTKPKWNASFSTNGGANWRETLEGYVVNIQVNPGGRDFEPDLCSEFDSLCHESPLVAVDEQQEREFVELTKNGLILLEESESSTRAYLTQQDHVVDQGEQEDYVSLSSGKYRGKTKDSDETSQDPTALLQSKLTQLQTAQDNSEKVIKSLINQKRQLRQERKLWLKREGERLGRERLRMTRRHRQKKMAVEGNENEEDSQSMDDVSHESSESGEGGISHDGR